VPVPFLTVSTVSLIVPYATALGLADPGTRSGTASGLLGMCKFGVADALAPLVSVGGATPLT
jgi:MFS transporter, DHA1 family, multidrug resistance protein